MEALLGIVVFVIFMVVGMLSKNRITRVNGRRYYSNDG